MGQKWLGEELLKFYTFIIFNFKFVSSRHLSMIAEAINQNEAKAVVPSPDQTEEGTLETLESSQGEKLMVKRRPMSNQFYKDMLDYITKTYGNPNKRLISHLRCKMSKFFGYKDISEDFAKDMSDPSSSTIIRWKNSIITFEDLNTVYQENPSSLLVSDLSSYTQKPNIIEEEIIRNQIEKHFGIYLKISECSAVNNFTLNSIDWPSITPQIYSELK